jgi:hypothetical protein
VAAMFIVSLKVEMSRQTFWNSADYNKFQSLLLLKDYVYRHFDDRRILLIRNAQMFVVKVQQLQSDVLLSSLVVFESEGHTVLFAI